MISPAVVFPSFRSSQSEVLNGSAPVDVNGLAGDVAGVVTQEEGDGRRDFGGLRQASQRSNVRVSELAASIVDRAVTKGPVPSRPARAQPPPD